MIVDENEKNFLNSVMYEIRQNENVLVLFRSDAERFWAFFENNFDEAKESKIGTKKYDYIKSVADTLKYLFDKNKDEFVENQKMYKATIELYSAIKTIKFIKGLDDDKDA